MTDDFFDKKIEKLNLEIGKLSLELQKLKALPVLQNCNSCGHLSYGVCDQGACPVVPQSVVDVLKV
jgi:hypothetical protein